MNMGVKIYGGRELAAKLKTLSDGVAGRALERAATSGALLIQNAAKTKAPFRTGNLRRSIHTETKERSRTKAVVQVGTDVVYGPRIEFGFSGTDKRGRRYNQPPHPYLRPAMDEQKDNVAREAGEALKILLGKV